MVKIKLVTKFNLLKIVRNKRNELAIYVTSRLLNFGKGLKTNFGISFLRGEKRSQYSKHEANEDFYPENIERWRATARITLSPS